MRTQSSICAAKFRLAIAKTLRQPVHLVPYEASTIHYVRWPCPHAGVAWELHSRAQAAHKHTVYPNALSLHLAMGFPHSAVMRRVPNLRNVLRVYRSVIDRLLHREIATGVEGGQRLRASDGFATQAQHRIRITRNDAVDVRLT